MKVELDADRALRSVIQRELAESEVLFPVGDDRTKRYRERLQALERSVNEKQQLLADWSTRMNRLDFERRSAEAATKAAEVRLQETHSALGYRGDRLRIIDTGVVPASPSSPNIPLNMLIAFFGALVLSIL